ncbi:MAG TPA: class I SAM-dependent methyltransferase [Candidatus Methylomirabilis sp.]|nr:class I SAM-dependent methyltransferase [Candidatus Methylomirabilis sp.]
MEARAEGEVSRPAERFFRDGDYWRAWSAVPDLTVDIDYALRAVRPGDRCILDAPCGRGRLLRAVARRAPGAGLFGLDVSVATVAQARREVPAARVMVGSVYAMPFGDRSFDAVLCNESFMHFDDPRRALGELCRVARDRVYLSVTTRRQINTLLRRLRLLGAGDVPHWTYNIEELRPLLPDSFDWRITGAVLLGRKALRLSHAAHRRLHRALGRLVPQPLLRAYGQTLFAYGWRK